MGKEKNGFLTARRADLDVQRVDAQLLATNGDVLGRQHGGVGRGLVAVGFDFHAAGDAADGFAAARRRGERISSIYRSFLSLLQAGVGGGYL